MELVSVIMPCYNSERFVAESINSVLKQSYSNWELIVVDDCSTDMTASILEEFSSKDSRIKLYRNSDNSGAAVTRNAAIEMASGKYVAFLDSDDIWNENKLKVQIEFMRNKDINFSFTSYSTISEDGVIGTNVIDANSMGTVGYNDMLSKRATIGCSTVVIKKRIIGSKRMPLIRTGQDYAFWLSILKDGESATCLKTVLTYYRIVNGSISSNKLKKAKRQWQIYREIEGLSFSIALFHFANYGYRAIFRK
ncbi:glycosyltransferase family 2 protein [Ferrimonas gelatinilytica]|uniref:Glycosyltransferase family 2 protein n=1 Tax=Ferrimonas gelatinilytica TaxID=1255257 RepID=A0ABP9RUS3_9GAMM